MTHKHLISLLITLLFSTILYAQSDAQRDSVIQSLLKEDVTPTGDQGITLIKSGEYESANKFFSSEISADQSNSAAYFRRGVANWALSDTLNACRDWSAVLAMGDTEMFNLLDSKCHGSMIISNDTIPSKQYRKMFAKSGSETASQNAKTVVDEMPQFPGGDQKLVEYMTANLQKPKEKKRGTVYVNFLVSPKGKIVYPYVAHGLGGAYDKEALRLIRAMPAWKPGKQKGKAVYVRSSLPVRF